MPIPADADWDQLPDPDGRDAGEVGTEIYDSATIRALNAVIEYIDRMSPTAADVRMMCVGAIRALQEAPSERREETS